MINRKEKLPLVASSRCTMESIHEVFVIEKQRRWCVIRA
jgi:hypothetical protein